MIATRYGSFGAGKYHVALTAPHCRIAPTDIRAVGAWLLGGIYSALSSKEGSEARCRLVAAPMGAR